MNIKVIRFLAVFFSVGVISLFTSCESEIRIRANQNGVDFTYRADSGEGFSDLLFAIGEEEEGGFNTEVIEAIFAEAGFEKVSAKCTEDKSLIVKGNLPESAKDPISASGMLSFSVSGNFINFKITKEGLNNFYQNSPETIQNLLDILMGPTFTGEEMSDSEYLDLLASVYGQKLADELAKAKIRIVLESPTGKVSKHTIGLLTLLNLTGKIELNA